MTGRVTKNIFDLDVDENGFPPISSESLNAEMAQDDGFILSNTPFFVTGVALGDRVEATPIPGAGAKFRFVKVLEPSTAKAVSVIFLNPGIKQAVYDELKNRGCYTEYGEFHRPSELEVLAVSIPEECDYGAVYQYLSAFEERDELSFAELAV